MDSSNYFYLDNFLTDNIIFGFSLFFYFNKYFINFKAFQTGLVTIDPSKRRPREDRPPREDRADRPPREDRERPPREDRPQEVVPEGEAPKEEEEGHGEDRRGKGRGGRGGRGGKRGDFRGERGGDRGRVVAKKEALPNVENEKDFPSLG